MGGYQDYINDLNDPKWLDGEKEDVDEDGDDEDDDIAFERAVANLETSAAENSDRVFESSCSSSDNSDNQDGDEDHSEKKEADCTVDGSHETNALVRKRTNEDEIDIHKPKRFREEDDED